MKKLIQLLSATLLLLTISCNQQMDQSESEESNPVLIKIGYYPVFHQSAETILNLNEKYLVFYSPTGYYPAPPPPPNEESGALSQKDQNEYDSYRRDRPELVPFKTDLSDIEVSNIRKFINSFAEEDFSDENLQPGLDGMSTNIVIVNSDQKMIQINPMNDPKPKQKELFRKILQLLIEKNTHENNTVILQKINEYV